MRVLICGSRTWRDFEAIVNEVKKLPREGSVIIEGCAPRGADHLAERAAFLFGIPVEHYPANWGVYGRRAGYVRNEQMLKQGQPDEVWAFWDGSSKGTANMVNIAQAAGVTTRVFREGKS